MPAIHRPALLLPALSLLALALVVTAARAEDEPDLTVRLPAEPSAGQLAPAYVDAFEDPGRLLYRFDAVIANEGGTLDVFRDGDAHPAMQAIWDGGHPPPGSEPAPGSPPPESDAVTVVDRAASGASFSYVVEPDHAHWHFAAIARYDLLVPGGATRKSDKVGFCFFDGFDTTGPSAYFPEPDWAAGPPTWCRFDEPGAELVRMGLSPGASDRYRSQRHFQWVDATGLPAGGYVLGGVANPEGYVVESKTGNNVIEVERTIPGASALPLGASVASGRSLRLTLRGSVVAPAVPARRDAACTPQPTDLGCYRFASAAGPLRFALSAPPRHGRVELGPTAGLAAPARYTPAAGFSGRDDFSYVTIDERGLTSSPARVTIAVDRSRRARAAVARAAVRRIRGRWYAGLRVRARCAVRGVVRRGSRTVRRLPNRRLQPGLRRIALGRIHRGGPHRLVLRARSGGRRQRLAVAFQVPGAPARRR